MTPGRQLLLFATIAALACSISSRTESQSLVPDAGTALPKLAGGNTGAFKFASRSLGESRSVFVALPASYTNTARTYPVLFVLDGEASFAIASTVVSGLASVGHMPEAIVVAIPNTNRLRDLTPPGLSVSGSTTREGGDRFLDFLQLELMPALKKDFRANDLIVLAGHSSGGILATYAAATRPAFRLILALDTPTRLGNDWLPARITERTRKPAGHLRYVSLESRFGWTDSAWTAFKTAAPKDWRLDRQKLEHESHVSMPFLGLYLGLRSLFQDYAVLSAPMSPTTKTLAHYREIEKLYGVPLMPPRALLRRVTEDLVMEGHSAAAEDAYRSLVKGYGSPPDSAKWISVLAELAKDPPMTETVDGLLATPAPKTVDGRHLIGEWRGKQWISPEDKSDVMLRLRDSAGVIVGVHYSYPAPGVELVEPVTYLKLVPGGFEYGYMNGMRPRGLLLHEARVTGNKFEGQMRFGGIRFRPMEGPAPTHVVRFEYQRKS
ncbi:MAG TPA: alpha/beta hydrolase-fold protein [Gemmatimonadaceae bacterium]|nr:alpha/beta hydrolase-fold protein [Gemmatimonadaceae bacterium]